MAWFLVGTLAIHAWLLYSGSRLGITASSLGVALDILGGFMLVWTTLQTDLANLRYAYSRLKQEDALPSWRHWARWLLETSRVLIAERDAAVLSSPATLPESVEMAKGLLLLLFGFGGQLAGVWLTQNGW
jgi:hypothetical protein